MAIKPVLQYRNPDSTLDLNSTQAKIIDRAIFDGGTLSLSAISLQVTVAPFIVVGFDGMTAISDSNEVRSVPAPAVAGPDRVSYLILHLEYRSLTSPISNLQVVPESTWTTSVSKPFFVTFAKFSIPFGATSMTSPGVVVDYSAGDWADKLGKTGWRMPVANAAALPLVGNRDADIRIALDTRLGHIWNATTSSWSSFGGAVDLQDVAARSAEHRSQWHRATSGSGFVNSISRSDAQGASTVGYGSDNLVDQGVGFPLIPLSSVANSVRVPGCHFMVNGHFVKTHARDLVLTAPPGGAGERFDLLFLEVWRVAVTLPSSVLYDGVFPTVSSTFATLRTTLERMLEVGNAVGLSYDFSEIEAFSSTEFAVTAYQFRTEANVNSTVLSDSASIAPSINNVDGNAFDTVGNTDQRVWQATASTSSIDGVSWAIPLVVIRRSGLESGPSSYITTYKVSGAENQRFIFDVAPRAELGFGLFETTASVKAGSELEADSRLLQMPSGFVKGATDDILIADGTLTFPRSVASVLGHELVLKLPQVVSLPAPPTGGGEARTDLVVLEVFKTIHSPPSRVGAAAPQLEGKPRIGTRQEQWVARTRVFQLPVNVLQTTVEGAMVAAATAAAPSASYTLVSGEPCLWKRSSLPTEGVSGGSVFALPLCLVHRRNTTPYTLINQNGADRSLFPGLPNQPATFPYEGEVLDLRSRVVTSADDLQRTLDESFDKLLTGELRTNMRVHPLVSNIAGTKLLQVDQIASAPVAGTYTLPSAPNSHSTVWAESDEAELVTWSFPMTGSPSPTSVFSWDPGTTTLTITCPPGCHLSLDPNFPGRAYGPQNQVAFSTSTGLNQEPYAMTEVYGSGSVPVVGDPSSPTPLTSTTVNLSLSGDAAALYAPSAATVNVAVWVIRKNHEAGRSSASNTYANNRGLFAVPDLVHRVEYDLTGGGTFKRAWVGPILNTIDIPLTGDFLVISQSDLFSLGSISSQIASSSVNLKSYAVTDISISNAGWAQNIETIDFFSGGVPGFDSCTITFATGTMPVGAIARVTLLCSGDLVDRWFEFDPSSKQVRGPYRVGFSQFAVPLAGDHLGAPVGSSDVLVPYSDCGLSVIGSLYAGPTKTSADPLVATFPDLSFYAAGSGNKAWQIWFKPSLRNASNNISPSQSVVVQAALSVTASDTSLGAHSSLYSVKYTGSGSAHNSLVLGCVRSPLPSVASVRVYYEYTPYQGITQSLESKINGTVEAISDDIIFTRGTNSPWTDPSVLRNTLIRSINPALINTGVVGEADIGLLSSSGRLSCRGISYVGGLGSSTYGGWFVTNQPSRKLRPGDRPLMALSQRLPYPTKQSDGIVVSSYVPESFLANTVLLSSSPVRPIPVTSAYVKQEASVWLLEWSLAPQDGTRMWRSYGAAKTLYFPLPIGFGEALAGLSFEVESTGSTGTIEGSLVLRDRVTGVISSSQFDFLLRIPGTAPGTRYISHVSIPLSLFSSSPTQDPVVQLVSSGAGLKVGQVLSSVLPASIALSGGDTVLHFPSSQVTPGVGRTLRKGMKIEVPSSWTSELSDYESGTIQDGRRDVAAVAGSSPRGKSVVVSGGPSLVYGSGGGLVGYVPGSDFFGSLTSVYNATPTAVGREAPPVFSTRAHPVVTGSTALDCAVGAASAYLIKNHIDATYMGVSTGYSALGVGVAYTKVGAAVDAFYPVGRPVFRRT